MKDTGGIVLAVLGVGVVLWWLQARQGGIGAGDTGSLYHRLIGNLRPELSYGERKALQTAAGPGVGASVAMHAQQGSVGGPYGAAGGALFGLISGLANRGDKQEAAQVIAAMPADVRAAWGLG